MTSLNIAGQFEEFVVEQLASAAFCVVTHALDEHVISVSHDTLGSEPYSHVCSPLQMAPACGFEVGQEEVLTATASAAEDSHPTPASTAPPTIAITATIVFSSQAVMAVE